MSDAGDKVFIRRAKRKDMREIRDHLLKPENLDTTYLRYNQFVICRAYDVQDDDSYIEKELTGCARLKPLGSDFYELANVAVSPAWQDKKIGINLISCLIQEYPDGMPCVTDGAPLLRGVWTICERKDYPVFQKHQFFPSREGYWPKSLDIKIKHCRKIWGEDEIFICHYGTIHF
jgi:hypothetical protein